MRQKYTELSIIAVSAAVILASMVIAHRETVVVEEIVAQLMLLGVLIAAVKWGRNGGFVAALVASLVYLMMRLPLIVEAQGLTYDLTVMIVVRVLSYGFIGIAGGELCARLKQRLDRLEGSTSIDDWTEVFNQRFIARSIEVSLGQFDRYHSPFSLIRIMLTEHPTYSGTNEQRRAIAQNVARHVRRDIRLVDDVGRLDDGSLLIVLPHTTAEGAKVVAERISSGISALFGSERELIGFKLLSAPEQRHEIAEFLQALQASSGTVVRGR